VSRSSNECKHANAVCDMLILCARIFYFCVLLKLCQGAGGSPRSSVSVETSPPASPSLGPKAQAAVDSAREVVRRVLSVKVCQEAATNANMRMQSVICRYSVLASFIFVFC
jgi:hypothetical protein